MLTKKQKMQILAEEWGRELQEIIESGCKMLNMEHAIPHIEVKFSTAMKTNGGTAQKQFGGGGVIAINLRLCYNTLLKEGPEKARIHRENTFWHELAHILAGWGAGHGPEWKRVMRRLGRVPDRCHRQDTKGLRTKQRRYLLLCGYCRYPQAISAAMRTRMKNKISHILEGNYGQLPKCPRCLRSITITDLDLAKKIRIPTPPPPRR